MKTEKQLFCSVNIVVFLMFFLNVKTYASDYTITFTGSVASNTVESVIVQNLTQGTSVIVPVGSDLTLSVTPNAIDQLIVNNEGISIFPNPMFGKTKVSFYTNQAGSALLNVFGIDGKQVIEIAANFHEGKNSFMLSLPKGIYAIQIAGNGYSYASKVISQNSSVIKPEVSFIGADKKVVTHVQKSKSVAITMLYTEGDRLLYKGISGNYSTIVVDVPTTSKNTNFNFVACKDADLNNYTVVSIGDQTWMAENLKTSRYRDGGNIPNVTDYTAWAALTTSAWTYYDNEAFNDTKYGKLYNWFAVADSSNIAPAGWHVPTDAEWSILDNYLLANGFNYDGTTTGNKYAKSLAANTNWASDTGTGAVGNDLSKNNSTGFSALPGGLRGYDGSFSSLGHNGNWWNSPQSGSTDAWGRSVGYGSSVYMGIFDKTNGFSVRCLRDVIILTTKVVSAITETTASCGGDIIFEGGVPITASGICWSTSEYPTITDNKTIDGAVLGSFTSLITGLAANNTVYYVRAYATNSVETVYGNQVSFKTYAIMDIDGNGYSSVTIGTRTWMTENLKTTKLRNGESISNITDNTAWASMTTSAWSDYNNDPAYGIKYGKLYNWYAVSDTRNIAPVGWHVATDAEWKMLENHLIANGYNYDGSKTGDRNTNNKIAKSLADSVDWNTNTVIGTIGNDLTLNNSSGFSALPGGSRYLTNGTFSYIGNSTYWWSSTENSVNSAWNRYTTKSSSNVSRSGYDKYCGMSVRCVKDITATFPVVTTIAALALTDSTATSGGDIIDDGGVDVTESGVCWSTTENPTMENNKTTNSAVIGAFSSSMNGLTANTIYYVRAYATNSVGTAYGNEFILKTYSGTITDIDGNVYNTVVIGTQTWIVENLKTTKYRTGESIANVTDNNAWAASSTGAWCYYNNAAVNGTKYGKLYNWFAVTDNRNIAPVGWHVATNSELITLYNYISTQPGTLGLVSKSLAAATDWNAYTTEGTVGTDFIKNNSSGFSALPAGARGLSGSFIGIGRYGGFWCSSKSNATKALFMALIYNGGNVDGNDNKQYGLSVRCVKD